MLDRWTPDHRDRSGCTQPSTATRSSAARARTRTTSRSPAARCRARASRSSASIRRIAAAASLRAMMDAQLRDVHERGEPIAALWASEETIYGRFGYGLAAWAGEMKLPREWCGVRAAARAARPGALRDAGGGGGALPAGLGGAAPAASGRASRARRRGGSCARCGCRPSRRRTRSGFVVLELDGASQATRSIARTSSSRAAVSNGRTEVIARRSATTPQATAELWRYLLDIDWSATITCGLLPPDHPLFLLLANPRRLLLHGGRLALGAARRRRRRSLGARVRGRGQDRLRRARCRLPVERGTLGARGRRCGADRRGCGHRARRRRRSARRISVRSPSPSCRDALRLEELQPGAVERADALFAWRPLPVVPRDLLRLSKGGGYTPARPGRLAQLGEHQLDKLGVTGSSPVAPIRCCRRDNML